MHPDVGPEIHAKCFDRKWLRSQELVAFMQRTVTPELLDSDTGTPAEIAASLADLRRINRWFGGARTTTELLRRVARESGRRELSLLEVAAGSGDVPASARRTLAREGVTVSPTLLDRSAIHMNGESRKVVGDALALPFCDAAFDVVGCSLFAHHLEAEQVGEFVREALRVCRVAVVINDLVRNPVHLALIYAGLPLFRSRITRHDSVASVWNSHTPQEFYDLVCGLGSRVEISRHYLFRMGVIVWK